MFPMAVDKTFNPKISTSSVLGGRTSIKAIAAVYNSSDFLKGDERYKFHWAAEGCATLALHF
jgi:hypothetical protein